LDKKKSQGYYTDPNGYHIFPENTAIPIDEAAKLHQQNTYTITDHGDKTYTITENEHKEVQPKQEKSADELIAEARKYLQKQEEPKPKPLTNFEKELEQSTKQWDQYFREHPDKIPYKLPKTIFDLDKK
jgi:hypothetical protein